MEEKERQDRLQEIQQHTHQAQLQQSSLDQQPDITSHSVGPFCLRRPGGGPPSPQGYSYQILVFSIVVASIFTIQR